MKPLDDQSDFKEIHGEIQESEIKKVANIFSISKSRMNNNLNLQIQKANLMGSYQDSLIHKNDVSYTFQMDEIADEMTETDIYLK